MGLTFREAHSPEEVALRQLCRPKTKMMRPRTSVTRATETFTVCAGNSPGAAETGTELQPVPRAGPQSAFAACDLRPELQRCSSADQASHQSRPEQAAFPQNPCPVGLCSCRSLRNPSPQVCTPASRCSLRPWGPSRLPVFFLHPKGTLTKEWRAPPLLSSFACGDNTCSLDCFIRAFSH